jgi:Ser/Thr protein kinase RdoA (MazF antagonist)
MRWVRAVHDRAEEAGFTIPRLVSTQDGRLVVDGITVERWIEGRPATKADRDQFGRALSRFHKLSRNWEQRPGFASSTELLHESKGGDVDLEIMPAELVLACRQRWTAIEGYLKSVVHGDPTLANVLVTQKDGFALLDWDESRVDVSLLDMVGLFEENPGHPESVWLRAKAALDAWEVAASWRREPEYARRRVKALLDWTNV